MLMQIDGTFIFAAISFLIFLFIIKTILYCPISKILDERENFYAKNLKMETESKEKSKALLEEKENLLKQTRGEAGSIVKETSDKAKLLGDKEIKKVKEEIKNKIVQNQNDLSLEIKEAKEEIKGELSSIVQMIVSKILNEDVKISLDDEKIKEYLKV